MRYQDVWGHSEALASGAAAYAGRLLAALESASGSIGLRPKTLRAAAAEGSPLGWGIYALFGWLVWMTMRMPWRDLAQALRYRPAADGGRAAAMARRRQQRIRSLLHVFLYGYLSALMWVLYVDPEDFKSWEDVYFFCGERYQNCTASFRWNLRGWTQALVLWNFVLSLALLMQKTVIAWGLNGLLPGEEAVARESLISIAWRLVPYWMNQWEQQWGAECSSMLFELPHFALELLIVLPCVQILCGRLRVMAQPHARDPPAAAGAAAAAAAANGPRLAVQEGHVQHPAQDPVAPGGVRAAAAVPGEAGQEAAEEAWVPDIMRCRWRYAPEQYRLLPRLRANSRAMAMAGLVLAVAAANSMVVPLALERRPATSQRADQILRLHKELSFLMAAGRRADTALWFQRIAASTAASQQQKQHAEGVAAGQLPWGGSVLNSSDGGSSTGAESRAEAIIAQTTSHANSSGRSGSADGGNDSSFLSSSGSVGGSNSSSSSSSANNTGTGTSGSTVTADAASYLAAALEGSSNSSRLDAKLAVWSTLWQPLLPQHWLRAMMVADASEAAGLNPAILSALQFAEHAESKMLTQQLYAAANDPQASAAAAAALQQLSQGTGDGGVVPSGGHGSNATVQLLLMSAMVAGIDAKKAPLRLKSAAAEMAATAEEVAAAPEVGGLSEGRGAGTPQVAATAVAPETAGDGSAEGRAAGTHEAAVAAALAADIRWLRRQQRLYADKAGLLWSGEAGTAGEVRNGTATWHQQLLMAPLYRLLHKHCTELTRMRTPEHRRLIPLIEVSLAIMRLSCERFFSLLAVFLSFLLYRDPPRYAQRAVRAIASLAAVFQILVLYSFPAICWAYGAGVLFSSFVSLVFWTGPLLRFVERTRNAATSVEPRQWRTATAAEVERMEGNCAICWGDMPAVSSGSSSGHSRHSRRGSGSGSSAEQRGGAGGEGGEARGEGTAPAAVPAGVSDAIQQQGQQQLQQQQGPTGMLGNGGGGAAAAGAEVAAAASTSGGGGAAAAAALVCGHAFHRECLQQWMQQCYAQGRGATCPMCQASVPLRVRYRMPWHRPPRRQQQPNNEGGAGGGGAAPGAGEGVVLPPGAAAAAREGIPGLQELVRALQDDFRARFEPMLDMGMPVGGPAQAQQWPPVDAVVPPPLPVPGNPAEQQDGRQGQGQGQGGAQQEAAAQPEERQHQEQQRQDPEIAAGLGREGAAPRVGGLGVARSQVPPQASDLHRNRAAAGGSRQTATQEQLLGQPARWGSASSGSREAASAAAGNSGKSALAAAASAGETGVAAAGDGSATAAARGVVHAEGGAAQALVGQPEEGGDGPPLLLGASGAQQQAQQGEVAQQAQRGHQQGRRRGLLARLLRRRNRPRGV